jgi:hypothetical protein
MLAKSGFIRSSSMTFFQPSLRVASSGHSTNEEHHRLIVLGLDRSAGSWGQLAHRRVDAPGLEVAHARRMLEEHLGGLAAIVR